MRVRKECGTTKEARLVKAEQVSAQVSSTSQTHMNIALRMSHSVRLRHTASKLVPHYSRDSLVLLFNKIRRRALSAMAVMLVLFNKKRSYISQLGGKSALITYKYLP